MAAAGKVYAGAVELRAGGANRASLRRVLEIADMESGGFDLDRAAQRGGIERFRERRIARDSASCG